MKNFSKEKRDRLVLIAVVTVVALAGIYYGLIVTQRTALADMGKRRLEEEARVHNGQRLAESLSQIRSKLETSSARLKSIESGMASGDMYSWIILTMNTFKENGGYKVEIPQFSREVQTDAGPFAKFPYRAAIFTLRGTAYFHDFGRFVADFENAFPYIRLQNIELEPAASANGNSAEEAEKLAFKLEIVPLINPNLR